MSELLINLLPIIVVIILLILKQHMLVAGFFGGIVALIIGGNSLASIQIAISKGLTTTFGYITPILFAAVAMLVSKTGSINAIVELANRKYKDKIYIIVGFLVIIQAGATFMAGTAAGNTMVIAPIIFTVIGAIPEVIAAIAIVGAIGFTISPASTETAMAAEAAKMDVSIFSNKMILIWLVFVILAVFLSVYGVKKKGKLITKSSDGVDAIYSSYSINKLIKLSMPALILLLSVIGGNKINSIIGLQLFNPSFIIIITIISVFIFSEYKLYEVCNEFIKGSQFILTTLFSVGIFLSFIGMIADLGLFEQVAHLVSKVPLAITVPVAMIISFLIAIPSGAFCAGVLALILPTLEVLNMPPLSMGFVAIAAGLGTQLSPVQINVLAISEGFKVQIFDVIKYNVKFILLSLIGLIVISIIFI